MKIDWAQFKNFVNARKTDILMLEDDNYYFLFTSERGVNAECNIDKSPSDTTDLDDFESNYKSKCNPLKETVVRAASPVNEHCMEPWGCEKGYFESKGASEGDYICPITLSNKSGDGLTFSYNSDCPLTPSVGNYVFQRESSRRSWIVVVDSVNHTITFESPNLDDGSGFYSRGFYVDTKVRDWAPVMYLWATTVSVIEKDAEGNIETDPCADFSEFAIVDRDDLFASDQVCQAVFGVDAADVGPILIANKWEWSDEYGGHWAKYYDESFILNANGKLLKSIDGSPGELLPGLYIRFAFFTTENSLHKYHIYLDHYPTSKP